MWVSSLAGFVLAAGLGTRISALSRLRPKPLLPVGQSTPLARAVAALRRAGASHVVANAAHLPQQVEAAGRALDVDVVVEQGGPFGTAGGLAHALPRLHDADAIAIWNGDIVAEVDVAQLHGALGDAAAVLAVRGDEPIGKGNVGVDERGRVVRLRDRSFGREVRGAWFAAVQVMSRALAARAPSRGCLVGDVLIPALERGESVHAWHYRGPWHDVGDLASYLAANVDAAARGEAMGAHAKVSPGVELARAVLGEGATLGGDGAAHDVVIWPFCRAIAPLSRAVVTEDEIVAIETHPALGGSAIP